MPLPTDEDVRVAVETVIRNSLAFSTRAAIAILPTGREVSFWTAQNGEISLTVCLPDEELAVLPDDQSAEKVYRLRIKVEVETT